MDFIKKVNRIRNFDSNTRIDIALKLAKKEMFTEANGMRPNLPNILFLITDGSQTKEDDWVEPAPIAAQLRASGNLNHFLYFIYSSWVRNAIHIFNNY